MSRSEAREVSRTAALTAMGANRRWTADDLAVIDAHLDRVRASRFTTVASNYAVKVYADNDTTPVMAIAAGMLHFTDETRPANARRIDWRPPHKSLCWVVELSNHADQSSGQRKPEPELEICTACFMTLPATGVCDCGATSN